MRLLPALCISVAAAPAGCIEPPPSTPEIVIIAPPSALPEASAKEDSAGPVTCALRAEHLRPDEPFVLQMSDGKSFATAASGGPIELRTGEAPTLLLTTYGVRFSTRATATTLPIYVREPHLLGGVLTPGMQTPLLWASEPGGVAVWPRTDPRVEWIGEPPRGVIPCGHLSLERSYGTMSAGDENDSLPAGTIELATEPSAQPVVKLILTAPEGVKVTELRDGWSRIVWWLQMGPLDGSRIEGWVKSAQLSGEIGMMGGALGASGTGMAGTSDWGGCGAEAPLYAEIGGVREQVGVVLPGTRVHVVGEADLKRSEIELLGPSVREVPSPLTLVEGARLLMRNEDAARCR